MAPRRAGLVLVGDVCAKYRGRSQVRIIIVNKADPGVGWGGGHSPAGTSLGGRNKPLPRSHIRSDRRQE